MLCCKPNLSQVRISLRYQYNPFDHLRTVRSSVLGFNKNPYKPYIFWNDLLCLKGKKSTVFRKCEYVYKSSLTHKSKYMPAKFRPEKTINIASISSHTDLKNRVSDFCHVLLLFFLQEDKV